MISLLCTRCAHFDPHKLAGEDEWTSPEHHGPGGKPDRKTLTRNTCAAFPDGIPLDIWLGRFAHTRKWPGDNGIRYQSRT